MTTIYCNGVPVPRVDDSKHLFHNRLTLIIGPSGSGKSALTQHILNTLRDTIPIILVACPTASMNGDYNSIVPDSCVYDDLTKPFIQRVFQRQQNAVSMHQKVHDINTVKPIFDMVSDAEAREKIHKLKAIFSNGCAEIQTKMDASDVEANIDALREKYHKKLVKHMRIYINNNMRRLQSLPMTDIQRSVVNHFNINPSLILIVDDCMATAKEWAPLEETKKLFYQGRHYHLTTILLCQATTLLSPQLRSNAHITIFTTEQIVNSYIKKDTAGFSKDDQRKLSKIASIIFQSHQDANKPNYKKLVLMGDIIATDHRIQYIVGSPRKKRFGSVAMWKLCNAIKKNAESSAPSSFNKMFCIKQVETPVN